MHSENYECSKEECEKKREHVESDKISEQLEQCEKCYNGIFKTNAIAAKTYQIISLLWAEKHNKETGKVR